MTAQLSPDDAQTITTARAILSAIQGYERLGRFSRATIRETMHGLDKILREQTEQPRLM